MCAKQIIVGILADVFVRMNNTSVIVRDKTISVMDIESTKMVNTSDSKKVKQETECYILYTVLLGIILLLITTIICCHYVKYRSLTI